MINVYINEIENLVLSNVNKHVYHEKILNNRCKLYFDIETKKNDSGDLVMVDVEKFKGLLW